MAYTPSLADHIRMGTLKDLDVPQEPDRRERIATRVLASNPHLNLVQARIIADEALELLED